MKSPRSFVILAAGLSLLAGQAPAQSHGAGSDRDLPKTSNSSVNPNSSPDSTPDAPPSSTTPPSSGTSISGSAGVGAESGRTNVGDGMNNGLQVGALNSGFVQIDTDRDGRISLSEYNNASLLTPGRSGGSRATESTTSGTTGINRTTGSRVDTSTGGRSGSTTGVVGGAAENDSPSATFRELDRNGDGYLSRDELNASSNSGTRP